MTTISQQSPAFGRFVASGVLVVAGGVCGACLAWSYAVVVKNPTVHTWMLYNALYVLVLIALGATSVLAFTPVTTIADLLRSSEPPAR